MTLYAISYTMSQEYIYIVYDIAYDVVDIRDGQGHRHNELLKRGGGNLTKVKLHGVKLSGPIIRFALKKD